MRKLAVEELNRPNLENLQFVPKQPIVVLLDNLRSVYNVGSIFRTADAFLIKEIIIGGYTPSPLHKQMAKTALGATESVAWTIEPNLAEKIKTLKQQQYKLYAVEQTNNSILLENFLIDQKHPLAIVFGNEVEGVQQSILDECDGSIEIPQFGIKHSLNVSVAAGIVLWKITEAHLLRK